MSKIVERTLDFIELFAREQRALTLSEIARLLSIPPSSCHDVLATLTRRGFVYEPMSGKGYYPTHLLKHLTDKISTVDMTLQRVDEPLRKLRDITGETVSLARVGTDGILNLLLFPGTFEFGVNPEIGTYVRSYYATAAGRAYLGSLSKEERKKYFAVTDLVPLTPKTVIDVDQIETEIHESEKRGWTFNQESSMEGATTLAARFTSGGSIYIVTIPGPTPRIMPKVEYISRELVQTCRHLSDQ